MNAVASELNNCPAFNEESSMTQNNYGHSSYDDPLLSLFLKSVLQTKKINFNHPILDVGTGYGVISFELIKLGAKNIYINDLDKRNLECVRKRIDAATPNKSTKLTYLLGDIVGDKVSSQLPKNTFSLVVARNVIYFFTYNQLINFIKMLNQITMENGWVIIFFENSHINYLNGMNDLIFKAHKKFPNFPLNKIVENVYGRFTLPDGRRCSVEAYNSAPKDMKLPAFPCEISFDSGKCQLLLPEIVIALMNASGFNLKLQNSYADEKDPTEFLLFEKMKTINEKKIDANIKDQFRNMIQNAENLTNLE